jgi:hypothetical protein
MASYDMPADYSTSNYLDKEGQYHFMVTAVDENPTSKNGDLIDGIKLTVAVLAGTDPSQDRRNHSETIFNPSPTAKDGGNFARLKIGRLIRALGLTDKRTGRPCEELRGQSVEIDWQSAQGKQFVATIVPNDRDPRFVQVSGAHFYKVTDPEVASVPKNEKALRLVAGTQTSQPVAAKPAQAPAPAPVVAPVSAPVQVPVGAAAGGNAWDELF